MSGPCPGCGREYLHCPSAGDECEATSHQDLFRVYAANLRADADRHQADADRLRALAEYADRLAEQVEP